MKNYLFQKGNSLSRVSFIIYQGSIKLLFSKDLEKTFKILDIGNPPPCPIVQRHPRAVVNAYKYRTYTYHP